MSREQMSAEIRRVYPGDYFAKKLEKMSDKQVYAMYTRLLSNGSFNKKGSR